MVGQTIHHQHPTTEQIAITTWSETFSSIDGEFQILKLFNCLNEFW